jgi:GNAT superfamily N-acetyltransferase
MKIRPYDPGNLPEIVRFSLLAWEPVFSAWQKILGPTLFPLAIHPDWRENQRAVVEKIIMDPNTTTWVADVGGKVVGFIAYKLDDNTKIGEVELLAVHPDYQNGGIGTELNLFALQKLKEGGMKLAYVGTGGDEGHAPARRSYEKAGYIGLPAVHYYKDLR